MMRQYIAGQGLCVVTCCASSFNELIEQEAEENPQFKKAWIAISKKKANTPHLLHVSIIMNRWVFHPSIEKVTRASTLLALKNQPVLEIRNQKLALAEWGQNHRK
jgi:hypothetical protein